ncbi:MAG TPA: transglutaminase domain-containing protein [Dehalococcoidia bacterium]|nr:transglutaminase domain-containing protein [Dehalococcoidia bacterium]
MAEMEWTTRVAAPSRREIPPWVQKAVSRYLDWEDLLTLVLLLGATMSVAATLEGGGWSKHMPALTLVSVLAVVSAHFLSRSRLPAVLAWSASVVAGATVVFWQALVMVGPGSPEQRIDTLYWRFEGWFDAAFNAGVSNDALPFNTLVLGITWLGVFLFAWSVFRWHSAWIGLVPGGIALFVDLAFVGDSLGGAALLYYLFGFLLIMRTNLVSKIAKWRAGGIEYPKLISFTFLNFSFWALLALILSAWILPTGPFNTPGVVQGAANHVQDIGVDFVRLAGPLRSNKVIPVHNYTDVLPFQGSVQLGDREVMAVKVTDPNIKGPLALRGAVYDTYESGGWKAESREQGPLSAEAIRGVTDRLSAGDISGQIIQMSVKLQAKTVAGTVLFSAGEPLTSSPAANAQVPTGSLERVPVDDLPDRGRQMSDQEILLNHVPDGYIGVNVVRGEDGRVRYVEAFNGDSQAVPDTAVLEAGDRFRKGTGYEVTSFLQTATEEQLRKAGRGYPGWVRSLYTQLPEGLPSRIKDEARRVATSDLQARGIIPAGSSSSALNSAPTYDIAKAIEDYIRQKPVDYNVNDTPPGHDTVDYFLFDAQRGYFDYHASAMVVMLRTLGIPARLAVGYVADQKDFSKQEDAYVVKDNNTYAWPEVYFPGYGWIMFNPTPNRPTNLYPQTDSADNTDKIDLSDFPGLPVTADPLFDFQHSGIDVTDAPTVVPGSNGGGTGTGLVVPALLGFAALLVLAVGLGWRHAVAGLPVEHQTWEKMVRLSSLAGHPVGPGQTPSEYADLLQKAFRGLRGVSVIASVYGRSRFGHTDASDEEQQRIHELWPPIRGKLLRAIVARVLRRGRPGTPDSLA